MPSKAQEITSHTLRAILARLPTGAIIEDSEEFRHALVGLEWFVPEVLGEVYPEWRGDNLDGIYAHLVRKTSEREVEIFGLCILMPDQRLTPIHLHLQLSAVADEVAWLELRLGEKGPNGMVRIAYPSEDTIYKRLHALDGCAEKMEWVYKVTFGEKCD